VEILLPVLAFAFVALVVAAAGMALVPGTSAVLERRLDEVSGRPAKAARMAARYEKAAAALKRLGRAMPKSPSEMGKLQLRLVHAGFRQRDAMAVFLGIRVGLALVAFFIAGSPLFATGLPLALGAGGVVYVLAGVVLARLAKRRQHRIRLGLPDALDLMVVSVEAGLGLDQSIQRVGDELAFAHPDLAEDLRLINLELRAGNARAEALHNLAARTGVDDLSSLVAVLVQTDKFGTSVANSLRVYSDVLRTKRRQRAEEIAAKTGVKLVFPLVTCIFPAIWVVTLGPTAIKFIQVMKPMAER
jgi:tight adherence protein C